MGEPYRLSFYINSGMVVQRIMEWDKSINRELVSYVNRRKRKPSHTQIVNWVSHIHEQQNGETN